MNSKPSRRVPSVPAASVEIDEAAVGRGLAAVIPIQAAYDDADNGSLAKLLFFALIPAANVPCKIRAVPKFTY